MSISNEIIKKFKTGLQGLTGVSEDLEKISILEEEDTGDPEDAIFKLSDVREYFKEGDTGRVASEREESEETFFALTEDHLDSVFEKSDAENEAIILLKKEHLSEELSEYQGIETVGKGLESPENIEVEKNLDAAVTEVPLETKITNQEQVHRDGLGSRETVKIPEATESKETYQELMSLVDRLIGESRNKMDNRENHLQV